MNVEYTGRQYNITPAIKKEVESGLGKIRKILGDKFEAKAILAIEKHRHKAEITINPLRNGPLVGLAVANEMTVAVGEAIEHLEKQAVKYKERWRSKKRQARKAWDASPREEFETVVGADAKTAVPVVVHKFPVTKATTEVHIVSSGDSVALRPMTVEEAVKEAHFRDRDVFVFRDKKGRVKVLHRTRDGKMELIEAP
jgi:putative sigma-54 modulation protein